MRERGLSQASIVGLVCVCVLTAACHHAPVRRRSDSQSELSVITGEDLFGLAMTHVQQSDLLRAEQYLNAARKSGYDEPMTVFWLVRVCVWAGRYHSALRHAASHLRDHPHNLSLRLVVASIHEALGNFELATSQLESIVEAAPRWALPRYRLGMLHRQTASPMEWARFHLEAYLRLDPNGVHADEVGAALHDLAGIPATPHLRPQPTRVDVRSGDLQ